MTSVTLEDLQRHQRDLFEWLRGISDRLPSTVATPEHILNLHTQLRDYADQQAQHLRTQVQATLNAKLEHLLQTITERQNRLETALASLQVRQAIANTPANAPERTFFSHAGDALAATNTLLNNLPPTPQTVQYQPLPLEELYGQLHALHHNLLQWLMHISGNTDRAATAQSSNQILCAVQDSEKHLRQSLSNLPTPKTATKEELHDMLQAIVEKIKENNVTLTESAIRSITALLAAQPSASNLSSEQINNTLPDYDAVHPTARCRTHGVLEFDNIHTKIPMDVSSRPASTALLLRLELERLPTESVLHATLYDAGALLTSNVVRTPHRLMTLPHDALALFHAHCPSFVYKLKRSDLC